MLCLHLMVLCILGLAQSETWTIGNDLITCKVTVVNTTTTWALYSTVFPNKMNSPSPLPYWSVHGAQPTILGISVSIAQNETSSILTVTQRSLLLSGTAFLSNHFFQVFNTSPFVKMWGTITNVSGVESQVDNAELVSLTGPCEILRVFYVDQWGSSWQNVFTPHVSNVLEGQNPLELRMGSFASQYGPAIESSWLSLTCDENSAGMVVGMQYNGKMTTQAWVDNGIFTVTVEAEHLNHTLSQFLFPGVFVGLFYGDDDEAGYQTQKFVEATQALPLPDDRYPYVQYDSWSFGTDISEEKMMTELKLASQIGLEVFVLDLGWATQIGNWVPDPQKFPNTLLPLSEAAHNYGIKLGLHIPLAQMAPDAPILRQNPDWIPYLNNEYFGATGLCLGNVPARDWVLSQILSLIENYKIDYFVQDGEDMIKHCTKSSHTHNHMDWNFANSVEGLDYIWSSVRNFKPDIVLENCEDGGTMLTQKVPQLYHTTINSDNSASFVLRLGIYGNTYAFSPRYNARYVQDYLDRYAMRSGMFGGPLILQQNLSSYNSTELEFITKMINEYKSLRKRIREGKVIHIQRPTDYDYDWDAIQSISEDQTFSVVFIYRANGGENSYVVKPRGLNPQWTYLVTYLNGETPSQNLSGQTIMNGIQISLPEHDSEVLQLEFKGKSVTVATLK